MPLPPLRIFNDFSNLKSQIDFQRFVSAWARQVHSFLNDSVVPQVNSNSTFSGAGGVNFVESDPCGDFTTSSATFVGITNLSVSITGLTGRPVMIVLQSDGSDFSNIDSVNGIIQLVNSDGDQIAAYNVQGNNPAPGYIWSVPFIDTSPNTPNETYTFNGRVGAAVGLRVRDMKMVVVQM